MRRGPATGILGLLLLLAASPGVCQSRHSGRRQQSSPKPDESTNSQVLPSFNGIVRGIDSKMLLLEEEDQNTMQFYCTKKTRYFDGNNKIKVSQIKNGDRVSVEARLGPDGKPEAVNVRLEHEKPAQGDSSTN